jgi:hypothetical protein
VIQDLDRFSVDFEFRRKETAWTVRADGSRSAGPVARGHKPAALNSRKPYQVHGGPNLDQLLGHVGLSIALGPDGSGIGTVSRRSLEGLDGGLLADEEWTFAQQGLDVLHGRPAGLGSRARHTFAVGDVLDNGLTDVLLKHTLRYRGEQSDGFEVTRRPGVRSRYHVRIHDQRLDRLLVLAAVVHFDNEHGDTDVRKLLPSISGLFQR